MAGIMAARQTRRAAYAALIGTTIEWYDFFVYGTASALVLGPMFFTGASSFVSLLAAFATFAVGFLARPFGGLFFGHLGDRFGRKRALITTLVLMGLATSAIGLLPGYAVWGAWAPVLLVLMRLIQGVSVGGEWGGAVLLAGEHAPAERRTWYASFAQLGSPLAVLLSLGAFRLANLISGDQFMVWGWRLPFLASILLLVVGLVIRLGVNESPEFLEVASNQELARFPISVAFRTAKKPIIFALCAFTIGTAGFYFTNTFLISYATRTLHIDRTLVLDCLSAVAIVQLIGQLAAARIAERIGDAPFLMIASGLGVLAPYPMFLLVGTGSALGIIAGVSIATLCASGFYAVIAGYASKIFAANIRYTAMSAAYQLGGAMFGGFTPILGVLLSERYTGEWLPLAIFYSVLAGVSFMGVVLLYRSGYGRDLEVAGQRRFSQDGLATDVAL
jgi:MFS family permease